MTKKKGPGSKRVTASIIAVCLLFGLLRLLTLPSIHFLFSISVKACFGDFADHTVSQLQAILPSKLWTSDQIGPVVVDGGDVCNFWIILLTLGSNSHPSPLAGQENNCSTSGSHMLRKLDPPLTSGFLSYSNHCMYRLFCSSSLAHTLTNML